MAVELFTRLLQLTGGGGGGGGLRPNFFIQRPNIFGWTGPEVLAGPGNNGIYSYSTINVQSKVNEAKQSEKEK
jgi:hypothetical protein